MRLTALSSAWLDGRRRLPHPRRRAAPADGSSGIPSHDHELWNRFVDDGTSADDGTPTDILHHDRVGTDPAVVAQLDALLPAPLQRHRNVGPVDVVLPGSAQQHRVLAHERVAADVAVMNDAVAVDGHVVPDRDVAIDEDRAELDDHVSAAVPEGEAIKLGPYDDAEDIRNEAEHFGHGAEDHVRRPGEHGHRPDDGPGQDPHDRSGDLDPSSGSILQLLDVGVLTVFDTAGRRPEHFPHPDVAPGGRASTSP